MHDSVETLASGEARGADRGVDCKGCVRVTPGRNRQAMRKISRRTCVQLDKASSRDAAGMSGGEGGSASAFGFGETTRGHPSRVADSPA